MNDFYSLANECHKRLDNESEFWGQHTRERSLEWDGTVMKSFETSQNAGGMLRVDCQGNIGSAYANHEELTSDYLIDRATRSTTFTEPDQHRELSGVNPRGIEPDDWYDSTAAGPVENRRRKIESALGPMLDQDNVKTLQVSYTERVNKSQLFRNSEEHMDQKTSSFSFGIWAICEQSGDVQTGYDHQQSWSFSELDFKQVGETAVKRGQRQLGAEPATNHKGAVLLTKHAASSLLRLARQMLDGESIVKGRSAWSPDRLGEQVASEKISIIDDPSHEAGAMNFQYDDEGHEVTRETLVEDGIFNRFLTNQYVAGRANVSNIHRASRDFKSRPGIGHSNFFVRPGADTFEGLKNSLGTGPVITGIQPGSGLDAVAGQLSVGAKGYVLSNGTIKHPFREGTLSGSFEGLLKNVVGIGDKNPKGRRLSSPALLVNKMTLGGASN